MHRGKDERPKQEWRLGWVGGCWPAIWVGVPAVSDFVHSTAACKCCTAATLFRRKVHTNPKYTCLWGGSNSGSGPQQMHVSVHRCTPKGMYIGARSKRELTSYRNEFLELAQSPILFMRPVFPSQQ